MLDWATKYIINMLQQYKHKMLFIVRNKTKFQERINEKDELLKLRGETQSGICMNYDRPIVQVYRRSEKVQALKTELKKIKVAKEKLKVAVTRVRKECDELKDINMTVAEALERETKKARKEEWSRNKL